MLTLDDGFSKAKEILGEASQNQNGIVTEEDSKIQIITRLITECLGWSYSDIQAEKHHENGFSDYILLSGNSASTVIEAKRLGNLKINTAESNKKRYLKLSGPSFSRVTDGIDQAYSYAAPNGIPIAIVTDGNAWIIFKTFIVGEHFKSKEAIVFPSYDAVLNDFSEFFELLSKSTFERKLYNVIFDQVHQNRVLLTQELEAPIREDDIKLNLKSSLAFDLDEVFSTFFTNLTGEADEDLLIECFVETKESRIADFSLEKMTARALGNLDPNIRNVDEELANLIQINVESEHQTSSEAGQTIFIIGPTGAGKTTYLKRFFCKTLKRAVRNECVLLRVNCLDSTGIEDTALTWLTQQLILALENSIYPNGAPSWEELRGLYFSEYTKRMNGVDAKLYQRDKDAFHVKFGEYLEQKVEQDREGYLRRILDDVVKNRKKLPILVIDNTDEFTHRFKQDLFQFAQSLRRYVNHCLIIFPVTDKSAWSFSKTDLFGIYRSKSFFLPTPSPREIFSKRIDFIKERISNQTNVEERHKYLTQRGIKLSVENISNFATILEKVFVDEDYTARTIGQLTNYNIRRTLLLSQRVMTSAVFPMEDLLKSYLTGTSIAPSFSKFMNALLRGDYELFKQSDRHEIFPLFNCDNHVAQSPLLTLRILTLLAVTRKGGNKSIDDRHLTVQSIHDYFECIGCSETALDRLLVKLIESRLVEPYDVSNRSIFAQQRLAITSKGQVHLQLGTHNTVFFEQMALTTPIVDLEVAQKIREAYRSNDSMRERKKTVRELFYKYLVHEDEVHLMTDIEKEQYESQEKLLRDLRKFEAKQSEEDQYSDLGTEFKLGLIATNVPTVVEWYSPTKGFGFVVVEGFEEQAFLHIEHLEKFGLDSVCDGDNLVCDIARSRKGIAVVNIHEFKLDQNLAEVVDCQIVKVFEDRNYGFVSFDDGLRDAFFHLSVVPEKIRLELSVGSKIRAEIFQDPKGRGLQIRRVLELLV